MYEASCLLRLFIDALGHEQAAHFQPRRKLMKYVKMLGFAAIATAALMAFAGASTASATVLCKTPGTGSPTGANCPAGQTYGAGAEIHMVSEGDIVFTTGSSFTEMTCKESTITAKTTNEGSTTETVTASIEAKNFTWAACSTPNGFCTTTTVTGGTLEIHWIEGTHNGTVTDNGLVITSSCATNFGTIHCIYEPANEDIGTLTGGGTATADFENTPINIVATSGLCPEAPKLDAKYEITTPKPLYVTGPGKEEGSEGEPPGGVLCKAKGSGSPTGTICPSGEAYPKETEIHAVNEGNLVLTTGSEFTEITCKTGTIIGKTSNQGSETESVAGSVEAKNLTWRECSTPNGACTVTTAKGGTVEVSWIEGTHNGTLTSNGAEITSNCSSIFGTIHCIYKPKTADLGTLTGGSPATGDIESTPITIVSTSGLCPSEPKWDAKYEITAPKPLYVAGHASTSSSSGGVLCKVEGTGSPTGAICPSGEAYPKETEIHAASEGNLVLTTGSEFTEITCKQGTAKGFTTNEGSETEAVYGSVEAKNLTWGECSTPNGKCTVTTVGGGTLEILWIEGTHNGAITDTGTVITSTCASIFGSIHCIYQPATEHLGTLTGGGTATADFESTPINIVSTSGLCPEAPKWDAKYEITTPKPLYVAGDT
jgi:hypothetical protein